MIVAVFSQTHWRERERETLRFRHTLIPVFHTGLNPLKKNFPRRILQFVSHFFPLLPMVGIIIISSLLFVIAVYDTLENFILFSVIKELLLFWLAGWLVVVLRLKIE